MKIIKNILETPNSFYVTSLEGVKKNFTIEGGQEIELTDFEAGQVYIKLPAKGSIKIYDA